MEIGSVHIQPMKPSPPPEPIPPPGGNIENRRPPPEPQPPPAPSGPQGQTPSATGVEDSNRATPSSHTPGGVDLYA